MSSLYEFEYDILLVSEIMSQTLQAKCSLGYGLDFAMRMLRLAHCRCMCGGPLQVLKVAHYDKVEQ